MSIFPTRNAEREWICRRHIYRHFVPFCTTLYIRNVIPHALVHGPHALVHGLLYYEGTSRSLL